MALLLVASILGVTALVAICLVAGGTRNATLQSAAQASAQVTREHLGAAADKVLLGRNRRAALVADSSGETLFAVTTLGDKFITRRLDPNALRRVELTQAQHQDGAQTLILETTDLTCRTIAITLDRFMSDAQHDEPRGLRAAAPAGIDFWLAATRRCMADDSPASNAR